MKFIRCLYLELQISNCAFATYDFCLLLDNDKNIFDPDFFPSLFLGAWQTGLIWAHIILGLMEFGLQI